MKCAPPSGPDNASKVVRSIAIVALSPYFPRIAGAKLAASSYRNGAAPKAQALTCCAGLLGCRGAGRVILTAGLDFAVGITLTGLRTQIVKDASSCLPRRGTMTVPEGSFLISMK
jgi:hypothetical protein